MIRLPSLLRFDWDEGNQDKNWEKHKVHFREAEEIFLNRPLKMFRDKKHSQAENRFQALGVTNKKRALSVIFTIRNKNIRIISARNQNKKERERYAKNKRT